MLPGGKLRLEVGAGLAFLPGDALAEPNLSCTPSLGQIVSSLGTGTKGPALKEALVPPPSSGKPKASFCDQAWCGRPGAFLCQGLLVGMMELTRPYRLVGTDTPFPCPQPLRHAHPRRRRHRDLLGLGGVGFTGQVSISRARFWPDPVRWGCHAA